MKKFLSFGLIFLILLAVNPHEVISEDSQSQSEQYRLQQIEKLQATKSSTTTASATKTNNQKITFIDGQIIAVNSSVILLETKAGTKAIYSTDTTKFFNLDSVGKKLIGLGDLKAGDKIYTIGLSPLTNSGSAKIVVRDQTKETKNFSLIGRASEITDKNLKLNNFSRNDLPSLLLTVSSSTKITDQAKKVLAIADIQTGDVIAVAGLFDDKNNLVTTQIYKVSAASKTASASAK